MKKILVLITLLISVFGSVNAQNLDDLRQRAYEAAIEAVNKGKNQKSAYEEYLERQELEAAKKAEEERKAEEEAKKAEEEKRKDELYWILQCCVLGSDSKNVCMKCYCYPMDTYIWYNFHYYPDGYRVKLYYNDNGDIGDLFFNSVCQYFDRITAVFDSTDTRTEAIRMKLEKEYIIFIQDPEDPYKFSIAW